MGRRVRKAESVKLIGLDSLIDKPSCTCRQNKVRNSFTDSHQQADVQPFPGKKGFNMCNSYLGRQKT